MRWILCLLVACTSSSDSGSDTTSDSSSDTAKDSSDTGVEILMPSCEGGPDMPLDTSCGGVLTSGVVEFSAGEATCFDDLADGYAPTLYCGPQGGYHLSLGAQLSGPESVGKFDVDVRFEDGEPLGHTGAPVAFVGFPDMECVNFVPTLDAVLPMEVVEARSDYNHPSVHDYILDTPLTVQVKVVDPTALPIEGSDPPEYAPEDTWYTSTREMFQVKRVSDLGCPLCVDGVDVVWPPDETEFEDAEVALDCSAEQPILTIPAEVRTLHDMGAVEARVWGATEEHGLVEHPVDFTGAMEACEQVPEQVMVTLSVDSGLYGPSTDFPTLTDYLESDQVKLQLHYGTDGRDRPYWNGSRELGLEVTSNTGCD